MGNEALTKAPTITCTKYLYKYTSIMLNEQISARTSREKNTTNELSFMAFMPNMKSLFVHTDHITDLNWENLHNCINTIDADFYAWGK